MMTTPVWTEFAQAELDDIIYYIGITRRRPETAIRLYSEIRDAVVAHLAKGAQGHLHTALPENWRYFRFKRWLIT